MTLVLLQYPSIPILFVLAALLTLLTVKLPKGNFAAAILACLAAIAMILCGLFYAVPMTELLILLLAQLLTGFLAFLHSGRN